jgi:hypothetical protein
MNPALLAPQRTPLNGALTLQAQCTLDPSTGRVVAVAVGLLRDGCPTNAGFRFPHRFCRNVGEMFIALADAIEAAS